VLCCVVSSEVSCTLQVCELPSRPFCQQPLGDRGSRPGSEGTRLECCRTPPTARQSTHLPQLGLRKRNRGRELASIDLFPIALLSGGRYKSQST
jgi:hypothetical protein